MSGQGRDAGGRFEEKVRDQDILKVFDYSEDPMLTAKEVADGLVNRLGIAMTTNGVRERLKDMEERELVRRKDFGAHAAGWEALVAPEIAPDVAAAVEDRREVDRDEFVEL
jgi:hypothetical protein